MALAREEVQRLRLAETGKYRALLAGIMRLARSGVPARGRALKDAYLLLARIEQDAPRTVAELVEAPQFGAWANDVLHQLRTPDEAGGRGTLEGDLGRLSLFAASAAIKNAYPLDMEVPLTDGTVSFPALGTLRLDAGPGRRWARVRQDCAAYRVQAGESGAPLPGALTRTRYWSPVPRVTVTERGLVLDVLLDGQDPFLDRYGAPRSQVGGAELDRWRRLLGEAWTLLAGRHPELATLVADTVRTVVPLASPAAVSGPASATEETSFGAIGLAMPSDSLEMAESLVHESHHAIVGALTDLEPLISPGDQEFLGHAPWREDPRPPHALLHGVYAHHAMGRFWRAQCQEGAPADRQRARVRFGRLRRMLADAIPVLLNSGQLTEAGLDVLTPIAAEVAEWQAESLQEPGQ
jgi:HEXXH motif-containing protein